MKLFGAGILIIGLMGQQSFGAVRKKAPPAKRPTGAVSRPATVGDLLGKIKTQGGQGSIQKKAIALPTIEKQKSKPIPFSSVKPPNSRLLMRDQSSDEAELERILDEKIKTAFGFMQKYRNDPNRGEFWLRLAENYTEKAKIVEYRIQADYDKKLQLVEQGKLKTKPTLNLSEARQYNMKAIQLYELFLRDFPKDRKVDQAMFFLGYHYVEVDQVKKGMSYYAKLTKDFPNSPYVSESHFAIGEYYFDNNQWKNAFQAYSQVLNNKRARIYSFALYKIGWCHYRLGRVADGLVTLEQVVKLSRGNERGMVSRIRLGSEALKDLVLFYADVGYSYKGAAGYFLQIGGEKAQFPMLEKIAYLYNDQGKRDAAYYVFKQLLAQFPTAPKAFDYQYQIVSMLSTSKNQGLYKNELYQWIENYGSTSAWYKANETNKGLLEEAYTLREANLRNFTLLNHKNAQNSGDKKAMVAAKDAYQLYLSRFEDSPKAVEMHFYYGELLFLVRDYPAAAKEYQTAADKNPKGPFFSDATLNALLALEKGLKTDEEVQKLVGNNLDSIPLGENEKAFITAAQRYTKVLPKGEKAVEVKFKTARLYYQYNQYDSAIPIFRDIIENNGRTPFAVYSANLLLDIYNIRKDYDALAREGSGMMRNKDLRAQGFTTDVQDIVEKASFKKGLDMEMAKNYSGAGDAFAGFAQKYPRSPLAIKSQFNAGVNFERAQKLPEAIGMYAVVVRNKDKNNARERKESILLLARLYEQTAQYGKAAELFETYANENPKDEKTPDLYYNAAVIYEGEKKVYPAIASYEKYFMKSRKKDRTQALFRIAKINEKRGSISKAIDDYEKYLNSGANDPESVVEANFRIAEMNEKKGRIDKAEKGYRKTISIQSALAKGQGIGASYAAQAKFKLAEPTYRELIRIRIPENPARQAKAIEEKLSFIERLNREMAAVIKYDSGDMVIAALARLGEAYGHLSNAILRIPIPQGLSAEESAQYKAAVGQKVKEIESQAIDNFTKAIDKSFAINYYNEWTQKALDAMSAYQPDKYPRPKEKVFAVSRTDEMGLRQ